jgi:hypothetical protein
MVTQKKPAEATTAAKPKGRKTERSSGSSDIRRLFEEAHQNFVRETQEAWQSAQDTVAEVNQKHFQAQHELQAESQKRAWEIHNDYQRALLDASGAEEGQERAAKVHSDYVRQQHELQAEIQQRAWELHHQHVRSHAEVQDNLNVRDRFEQIYRSYLQSLQRAWAEAEVSSLDPASLAAISQSLAGVASAASNIIGSSSASRR